MENDGLDELFAVESPLAVEDAATVADAPEAGFSPTEPSNEVVIPEVAADAQPLVATIPASDPVPAQAPEPETAKPAIDWEHPELQALRADAEAMRGLKSKVEEARRLKEQTDFQNKLHEFADGDSERLHELNSLMAAQTAPLRNQVQQYEARTNDVEKALAAFVVAAKANLSDAQVETLRTEMEALMAFDGPEVMERTAFGKRDFIQQHTQALSAKDQRIAELEAQIAAKNELAERDASGADRVDGGGGMPFQSSDRKARMENAKTDDEFFDAMWGNAPAPANQQNRAA